MRIKEVESLVGITKKNIRFYEKEGLLTPGRDSENSYRDYGDADVQRLKQIKFLRKLDMPITEIKALLEGETSLTTAARRHGISIAEQRDNLLRAQEMCERIATDGTQLPQLDTDVYLDLLENMEKEGAVFSNIVKNDVMKKYFGPVLACIIVVALAVCTLGFIFLANESEPAPGYTIAYICAIAAILVIGTIVALAFRIKEIRKGEEDDLSNY